MRPDISIGHTLACKRTFPRLPGRALACWQVRHETNLQKRLVMHDATAPAGILRSELPKLKRPLTDTFCNFCQSLHALSPSFMGTGIGFGPSHLRRKWNATLTQQEVAVTIQLPLNPRADGLSYSQRIPNEHFQRNRPLNLKPSDAAATPSAPSPTVQ